MKKTPPDWKPKAGDLVEIRALDHVANSDEVYEFFVWGRLTHVGRAAINVESWAPADPDSKMSVDENAVDNYVIVKRAITEIRRLT